MSEFDLVNRYPVPSGKYTAVIGSNIALVVWFKRDDGMVFAFTDDPTDARKRHVIKGMASSFVGFGDTLLYKDGCFRLAYDEKDGYYESDIINRDPISIRQQADEYPEFDDDAILEAKIPYVVADEMDREDSAMYPDLMRRVVAERNALPQKVKTKKRS